MNNYSRIPVPDSATVPGLKVAIVIFGVGATLPIFYIGSSVGLALGLSKAAFAITLSCVLVGILMLATSFIGARSRLSTYMLMQLVFGRRIAQLINLIMFVILIGYFSVTAEIFGASIVDMLNSYTSIQWGATPVSVASAIVMALTAAFGFTVLERFSAIAVPILVAFMFFVFVTAISAGDRSSLADSMATETLTIGTAVSAIVGANILMAVAGPDFARFTRNGKEAAKSVLGLLFGFPLIMLSTAILSIVTGEIDVMKIMLALGLAVPAFVILTVATWTTNTVNVYSATLALAAMLPNRSQIGLTFSACVIGVVTTYIGILDSFLELATYLGLIATPIAGVYITDFYVFRKEQYCDFDASKLENARWSATFAWGIGATCAITIHIMAWSITGVPAMDGLLLATFVYLGLEKL